MRFPLALPLALAALLGILIFTPARAREFCQVSLKTTLEYSSLERGTLTMGHASGRVEGGDDGAFSRMILDDQVFAAPFQIAPLDADSSPIRPWCQGQGRGTSLWIRLPLAEVRSIAHLTNGAWYRSTKTETQVHSLIDRVFDELLLRADHQYAQCLETHRASQCEKQDFLDLRPEYVDRTEMSDLDLTRLRFQFHDDSSPESLHVTFDFGNHVNCPHPL